MQNSVQTDRLRRFGRPTRVGILAAVALLISGSASAVPYLFLGGIDAVTSYTASTGVLSFSAGAPGQVTSVSVTEGDVTALAAALSSAQVNLDITLTTPQSGNVQLAEWVGAGAIPGFDITFTSGATVLLAFDIDFIKTSTATHLGGGIISLGSHDIAEIGNPAQFSRAFVSGGSLNALVGGIGEEAVFEILMSGMNPTMTKTLRQGGYLLSDFTNGAATTWNITVDPPLLPEPSTLALAAVTLLGALSVLRRRD